jgi:SAM-dependent methyltransferase
MAKYAASTYGDEIADVYDELYSSYDPAALDTLAELAGDGPVLELGIGTGRIALPLAARGLEVHGVEASAAMLEKLRSKPGGNDIAVTRGDFSTVTLNQRFPLIFVAFNTFFSLHSQEDQVRCFQSVASLLAEGGVFVLEGFVPDFGRDRGRLSVARITPGGLWLDAARHNPAAQVLEFQLVQLSNAGIRLFPNRIRYAWPSELDLMARLAGLRLRERWSGWQRQPFTASSLTHIAVYGRATP